MFLNPLTINYLEILRLSQRFLQIHVHLKINDILVHAENKPLTQLANSSHDITSLQNFAIQWKSLGNEINGVSESMLGNNPPSGTAWRQTEALLQESHSLFEIMTENKGLAIEESKVTLFLQSSINRRRKDSKEGN